jgi:hypothetical protein
VAKTNMATLNYRNTNIESLDLTDFHLAGSFAITKAVNADVSGVNGIYITGSRAWNEGHMVRITGDVGAFSWESYEGYGYYVINSNMNVAYGFAVPRAEGNNDFVNEDGYVTLDEGGLVDEEGNLVVGATTTNIQSDGSIKLVGGGTIVTPEGIFRFDGDVSIKNNVITTEDNYTFGKNTADANGAYIEDIVTTVEVGNGTANINTIGGGAELPAGSVVINDNDEKIYFPKGGEIGGEGEVITINAVEFDLADGDITVTENAEGELVITQNGEEHIAAGDTVISIVSSTENDNKVTVNGADPVTFEEVDGDIEVIGNSNVHVTGDVNGNATVENGSTLVVDGSIKGSLTNTGGDVTVGEDVTGDVETTDGGTTVIGGNVGGDVETDGNGSTTEIGENVGGDVTDTNGGETTVIGETVFEVDLKDGDITITKGDDGKLIISQNGVDTVIVDTRPIDVINTGDTDNKVVVNGGATVTFEEVDGDLEVNGESMAHVKGDVNGNAIVENGSTLIVDGNINGHLNNNKGTVDVTGDVNGEVSNDGGDVHIGGDVDGSVNTTNGGKTVVDGNIKGNVTTDKIGSTTEVGKDVEGTVTDSNGGKTTVGGTIGGNQGETIDLEVSGVPVSSVKVGATFTLTPNIAGGTWSFDSNYLEATKVDILKASIATASPSIITLKALKVGKVDVTYTLDNGQKEVHTITIVEGNEVDNSGNGGSGDGTGNTGNGSGNGTGTGSNGTVKAPSTTGNGTTTTKKVKTGDTSDVIPFGLMLALSLVAIGSVALVSKTRKKTGNR